MFMTHVRRIIIIIWRQVWFLYALLASSSSAGNANEHGNEVFAPRNE